MNFTFLEMLYNIPELQSLTYQLYQQMPERTEREANLRQVWDECKKTSTPELEALFDKLEDAENYVNGLYEQASFLTGLYFAWGSFREMDG